MNNETQNGRTWECLQVGDEYEDFQRDGTVPGTFEMLTLDHQQRTAEWAAFSDASWDAGEPIASGTWDYQTALSVVRGT